MAEKAISPSSILALFSKKAPIDRNSAWVSEDGLDHTDNKQDKEDVKYNEKDDVWAWLTIDHELHDIDEVINSNKNNNSDKLKIDEFVACHFSIIHLLLCS